MDTVIGQGAPAGTTQAAGTTTDAATTGATGTQQAPVAQAAPQETQADLLAQKSATDALIAKLEAAEAEKVALIAQRDAQKGKTREAAEYAGGLEQQLATLNARMATLNGQPPPQQHQPPPQQSQQDTSFMDPSDPAQLQRAIEAAAKQIVERQIAPLRSAFIAQTIGGQVAQEAADLPQVIRESIARDCHEQFLQRRQEPTPEYIRARADAYRAAITDASSKQVLAQLRASQRETNERLSRFAGAPTVGASSGSAFGSLPETKDADAIWLAAVSQLGQMGPGSPGVPPGT